MIYIKKSAVFKIQELQCYEVTLQCIDLQSGKQYFDKIYFGYSFVRSLTSIRGVMESIWANEAPRIVKDYTDHGEKHSERVAFFAEKLLQVNPDAKFSQTGNLLASCRYLFA